MLKKFIVAVFCAFILASCGGGSSSGGTTGTNDSGGGQTTAYDAATEITKLTDLSAEMDAGTITENEFLDQLNTIFSDEIGADSDSLADTKSYLEDDILGYTFTYDISASKNAAIKATDSETLLTTIKNSQAYQMFQAFLESVIFSGVPEPASQMIQVATPETFVTLSTVQVRTHIYDALFSGKIDAIKAQELEATAQTNPYDAERDLLTAEGETIPDWLQPAQTGGCLQNCPSTTTTYAGSFSKGSTFVRVFSEATCTWTITFTGNMYLSLSTSSTGVASGSARAVGTATVAYISGSTSNFTCLTDPISFDSTAGVSGSTSSLMWTNDLGGGVFPGAFTGSASSTAVTGNVAVSYTNGNGSVTIPLTLSKQ